jgi:hypothetical protein
LGCRYEPARVEVTLTINDRTSSVATAWDYADEDAALLTYTSG